MHTKRHNTTVSSQPVPKRDKPTVVHPIPEGDIDFKLRYQEHVYAAGVLGYSSDESKQRMMKEPVVQESVQGFAIVERERVQGEISRTQDNTIKRSKKDFDVLFHRNCDHTEYNDSEAEDLQIDLTGKSTIGFSRACERFVAFTNMSDGSIIAYSNGTVTSHKDISDVLNTFGHDITIKGEVSAKADLWTVAQKELRSSTKQMSLLPRIRTSTSLRLCQINGTYSKHGQKETYNKFHLVEQGNEATLFENNKCGGIMAGFEIVEFTRPLHLLVDFDFDTKADGSYTPEASLKSLLTSLTNFCEHHKIQPGKFNILSACTDRKISFHVRADTVFQDMAHLGRFMCAYVEFLDEHKETFPGVFMSDGRCAVDPAIYSKNRQMRQVRQQKPGKQNPLVPVRLNEDDIIEHIPAMGLQDEIDMMRWECADPAVECVQFTANTTVYVGGKKIDTARRFAHYEMKWYYERCGTGASAQKSAASALQSFLKQYKRTGSKTKTLSTHHMEIPNGSGGKYHEFYEVPREKWDDVERISAEEVASGGVVYLHYDVGNKRHNYFVDIDGSTQAPDTLAQEIQSVILKHPHAARVLEDGGASAITTSVLTSPERPGERGKHRFNMQFHGLEVSKSQHEALDKIVAPVLGSAFDGFPQSIRAKGSDKLQSDGTPSQRVLTLAFQLNGNGERVPVHEMRTGWKYTCPLIENATKDELQADISKCITHVSGALQAEIAATLAKAFPKLEFKPNFARLSSIDDAITIPSHHGETCYFQQRRHSSYGNVNFVTLNEGGILRLGCFKSGCGNAQSLGHQSLYRKLKLQASDQKVFTNTSKRDQKVFTERFKAVLHPLLNTAEVIKVTRTKAAIACITLRVSPEHINASTESTWANRDGAVDKQSNATWILREITDHPLRCGEVVCVNLETTSELDRVGFVAGPVMALLFADVQARGGVGSCHDDPAAFIGLDDIKLLPGVESGFRVLDIKLGTDDQEVQEPEQIHCMDVNAATPTNIGRTIKQLMAAYDEEHVMAQIDQLAPSMRENTVQYTHFTMIIKQSMHVVTEMSTLMQDGDERRRHAEEEKSREPPLTITRLEYEVENPAEEQSNKFRKHIEDDIVKGERGHYGTAELFSLIVRGRVLYDVAEKQFLIWDGYRFAPDCNTVDLIQSEVIYMIYKREKEPVENELRDAEEEMEKLLERNASEEAIKKLRRKISELSFRLSKLLGAMQNVTQVPYTQNVLKFVKTLLHTNTHEWPNHLDILGVENGAVDLRTGKIFATTPSDRISQSVPHVFIGCGAPYTLFATYVNQLVCGNEELEEFFYKWMGYLLSGGAEAQKMLFLYSPLGENGKSIFFSILKTLMGKELAVTVSADCLMPCAGPRSAGAAEPHVEALKGKRVATYPDLTSTDGREFLINAKVIKQLTGGDEMAARKLHAQLEEFKVFAKLTVGCNILPRVDISDPAILRRIMIMLCKAHFPLDETRETPVGYTRYPNDPKLEEKLKGEMPAILSRFVAAHLVYRAEGLQPLPQEMVDAFNAFVREQDIFADFIEEMCETSGNPTDMECAIVKKNLHKAFTEWNSSRGKTSKNISLSEFGKMLMKTGRIGTGKGTRNQLKGIAIFMGIKLKDQSQKCAEPECSAILPLDEMQKDQKTGRFYCMTCRDQCPACSTGLVKRKEGGRFYQLCWTCHKASTN